jgi:transglutaminase-like putative cysteine protease
LAALFGALAASVAGTPGWAKEDTSPIYLHFIPTEVPDGARFSAERALRVSVTTGDPVALSELLKPEIVLAQSTETLTLALPEGHTLPPTDPGGQLASTFLVDHDDASVSALGAKLRDHADGTPTIVDLVRFTSQAIPDKSMGRAWDTASRVASHGAGDCTEHAVLLAALARSFEIPARVVVGTVIVELEGEWQAYGHAWTEIFDGARWQLADAALWPVPGLLRYLPQGSIRDEGPGYMLDLLEILQRRRVSRVEVLGSAPTTDRNPVLPFSEP